MVGNNPLRSKTRKISNFDRNALKCLLMLRRLALVTGGEIVSTFDDPSAVKLGTCELIEQIMIGEDTLLRFSGVALGEACSIGALSSPDD